ncbi:hypothetical protein GDO81_015712 [Engystomops pustulosus]|uniref:Uncharacterized protein n=1 Tax=Engystomops pustulosus TaxID=76066 RepID=A0AAV7AR93_ENGPU|nr:hypothetical protein GDO81_015712 [Engystomops pustulosus]
MWEMERRGGLAPCRRMAALHYHLFHPLYSISSSGSSDSVRGLNVSRKNYSIIVEITGIQSGLVKQCFNERSQMDSKK